MKLFLTGGFLGSGKTTAIRHATVLLQQLQKKVGVITNDQGSQQVDTKFFRGENIPVEEVADGCFCCNFADLDKGIRSLQEGGNRDIIFAESVGSCADLVATVIKPLQRYSNNPPDIVLSVFADIRLVCMYLQNDKNIFYENVNYIYGKQLEEADIIIANKIDLLDKQQLEHAKQLIESAYPGKKIIYQDSLSEKSVNRWVAILLNDSSYSKERNSLEMDYDRYADGEAALAWLDEEIGIVTADKTAVAAALVLIKKIADKINEQEYAIGHLKFLLDDGLRQRKISVTSLSGQVVKQCADDGETDRVIVVINARVEVHPELLKEIMIDAITEVETKMSCRITVNNLSAFQPGYPKPTHRIQA